MNYSISQLTFVLSTAMMHHCKTIYFFVVGLTSSDPLFQGPSADHTPSSIGGKFAMVNLASLRVGDIVKFTTCLMPSSSDVCTLRFWYFMSGE